MDKTKYDSLRKAYSILTTLIMLIVIYHAIGQVILPLFIKLDTSTNLFNDVPAIGMMFSSSLLSGELISSKLDSKSINAISSVVTIFFILVLLVLSHYAIKGKHIALIPTVVLYGLDCIAMIPLLILNGKYPLSISTLNIVLLIVSHAICLAVLIAGLVVGLILRKQEGVVQND